MKILVIHNLYQQAGGEDVVAEREAALLAEHGHEVVRYTRSNDELKDLPVQGKLMAPVRAVWSSRSFREISQLIADVRPDIAHFHNTHLVISPAAYYACRKWGVPVVQSLHNPRLMCPAANLCREGKVCTECMGKTFAWPGIVHKCFRGSRLQTAGVAAVAGLHRVFGTWNNYIDRYIVFTDYYRKLFIEAGLPAGKIIVKQHFVSPDPGERLPQSELSAGTADYALYIGRLDPEKGALTLLEAWKHVKGISLVVRGGGQGLPAYEQAIKSGAVENVRMVGRLSEVELTRLIQGARFLVWPSEGIYETFGLVAIEAFACGVPVVSGNNGVAGELILPGVNGIHFEPGNPLDLAGKIQWAANHPEVMTELGRKAREIFEQRYTAQRNYQMLMDIYEGVLKESRLQKAG